MRILIILFLTLVSVGLAAEQKYITFSLASDVLGEKRNIEVFLPSSYYGEQARNYPAFYVLDGESNGTLVASMSNRMSLSNGSEEHIVVAIHSTDRLRDYAPTVNKDPRGPLNAGGGGDKFLDFIEFELRPKINKKFRTSNENIIIGHSVAGLLVLHSFHSRPDLFQAHMAFSPAVWWGEQETRKATQQFVTSQLKTNQFLYMNIGNESGDLREVYDAFAAFVTRNRTTDLTLHTEVYVQESHGLTLAAGLYSAFRGLHQYKQSLEVAP